MDGRRVERRLVHVPCVFGRGKEEEGFGKRGGRIVHYHTRSRPSFVARAVGAVGFIFPFLPDDDAYDQ